MRFTLLLAILGAARACIYYGALGNSINQLYCCKESGVDLTGCDVHSSSCWSESGLRDFNGNCPDVTKRDDADTLRSAPVTLCEDGCDSCPPGHAAEELQVDFIGCDGLFGLCFTKPRYTIRLQQYCIECAPGTYKTGGSQFSSQNKQLSKYGLTRGTNDNKNDYEVGGGCLRCLCLEGSSQGLPVWMGRVVPPQLP